MADLPFEECERLFEYDRITGSLTWKARPAEEFSSVTAWRSWNVRFSGKKAGCSKSKDRYVLIFLRKKTYRAHRVIWTLVHGKSPEVIDHINGDIRDNRIENLREVSVSENARNQKRRSTNTTGVTGVKRRYNSWRAEIFVDGKRHHLGKFDDIESAIAARKSAEIRFGFHPNHGRAA